MQKWNFTTVAGAQASGGELVKLTSGSGDLWTQFQGESGTYDLKVFVQDENDGESTIMVKINGQLVEAIKLDQNGDGGGSDDGGFSEFVIQGVEINQGDKIQLWVDGNCSEFARIDKIELTGCEPTGNDPVCYTIEAEDMQKWNFTTVAGAQASEGELVKLTSGSGDLWTHFQGESGTYDLKVFAQDENDGESTIMVKINGQLVDVIKLDQNDDGGGSDDGGFSEFVIQGVEINQGDKIQLWVDGNCSEYARIDRIELTGCEPATGSISGRMFCDTDCDGLDELEEICEFGPNLIVNGDFENHPQLQYGGWGLFSQIEGWVAIKDKIEIQEDDFGTGNTAGNAVVELDADNNATICQIVDITEAGTYQFCVDYAMRGTDPGTNGFAVYINGVKQAEIYPSEPGFKTYALDLDLPVGEVRVDLKGLGDSDCIGTVVDNVKLQKKTITVVESEPPVAGVEVKLIDGDGNVVATTTTDADGRYTFDDVTAGDYQVMFGNDPTGKVFTFQDVGDDERIDSDVDATGMTGVISVAAGQDVTDVDAGVKEPKDPGTASLSGRYFCDENNNAV
ncbi:MAG: carboxypeptidase regulatory-like domain-containing protein, partial [Gammaproteobacteria bacterium]|nr:carboxypeptidase regulatory-like domain-containing protein [Gammaproteobacteria bacterium]